MAEGAQDGWTDGPVAGRDGAVLDPRQLIARANVACEQDDFASALSDFEQVLATHPDFPDVRNWAGVCQAMLGRPDGALEEFDHAVRLNPRYSEALLNRALILCELGREDEAGDTVERLRALDASHEESFPAELGNRIAVDHGSLGDLYMQAGRPEEATEEYGKALGIRPGFVDIRNRLAQAYVAMEELTAAVDELRLVLAEHPSYLDARVRLGAILQRLGHTEDAIAEWRRCLEIAPQDRRARAYLIGAGLEVHQIEVADA